MENTGSKNISASTTLASAVIQSLEASKVFDSHEIDYGNFGSMSIHEACASYGTDEKELLKELNDADGSLNICGNTGDWEAPFLCEFIKASMHARLLKRLPEVRHRLAAAEREKIIGKSAMRSFREFADNLQFHINKEQRMIFPYIRRIASAADSAMVLEMAPFGRVANPLKSLEAEHSDMTRAVKEIIDEVKKAAGQNDNNKVLQTLLKELKELASALRLYIHFENNLLFPKTIMLERRVLTTTDRRKISRKTKIN
ncbi:MAG: DUF542 domain-containing protein [Ignavibacteria bacterium]|nr:DUF542 domain-containing protein [Ignavibacteria bacterium]